MLQVTAVLLVPTTVAVNCCVCELNKNRLPADSTVIANLNQRDRGR